MKDRKLIIVSAPSGAGKTTLVHYLLEEFPELEFSVSCTTREKRPNEKDGVDYYFLGPEGFRKKQENGAFVESEEVYPDHFYGTLKSEIDRIHDKGNAVIFDIDVEGGLNIKKQYPEALSIFIAPPDMKTLEKRLKERSTEVEEKVQMRVDKAKKEMAYQDQFDEIIVNDNLEEAEQNISKIVRSYLD